MKPDQHRVSQTIVCPRHQTTPSGDSRRDLLRAETSLTPARDGECRFVAAPATSGRLLLRVSWRPEAVVPAVGRYASSFLRAALLTRGRRLKSRPYSSCSSIKLIQERSPLCEVGCFSSEASAGVAAPRTVASAAAS